jgi:hypothetical protein
VTKGGWSPRRIAVVKSRGIGRALIVVAAVLMGGLLLFGVAGCGNAQQLDGDSTPGLPTASTTEVAATSSFVERGTNSDAESSTTTAEDSSPGKSTDTTDETTSGATDVKTTAGASIGEPGAHRNPIPVGHEAQVGNWKAKVSSATLNATQAVLDENMFNEPPDSGSQYVLVGIEATYTGEESSTFWVDMMCTFVGGRGDTFESETVVAPDSILNEGEVSTAGTISGNLVFMVRSDQIAGGTLMLKEAFLLDEVEVFFAVE